MSICYSWWESFWEPKPALHQNYPSCVPSMYNLAKKIRYGWSGIRHAWILACVPENSTIMKTCFASKVVMFQQAVHFRAANFRLCYSRQTVALQNCVPSEQTWVVVKAFSSTLSLVVSACVWTNHTGIGCLVMLWLPPFLWMSNSRWRGLIWNVLCGRH